MSSDTPEYDARAKVNAALAHHSDQPTQLAGGAPVEISIGPSLVLRAAALGVYCADLASRAETLASTTLGYISPPAADEEQLAETWWTQTMEREFESADEQLRRLDAALAALENAFPAPAAF